MEKDVVIDLTVMPSGERYEDRYGAYLGIFHQIAMEERKVVVVNPPSSWVPLLFYLGAWIKGQGQRYFEHCHIVEAAMVAQVSSGIMVDSRTAVEVLCGFRPETTDALWKVDMQWLIPEGRRKQMKMGPRREEFIVTNNGSFHRSEVLEYLVDILPQYTPQKRKVVLVPCAADKPYPAKLHQEVLKRMPEDYYLAIHTGVLGIVPQDLWPEMPYYDSGLPNEWRLMEVLVNYFSRFHHKHVVVYADYYSLAIWQAFISLERKSESQDPFRRNHKMGVWTFVNPVKHYDDYIDLLSNERLAKLEEAFQKERQMV